MSEDQNNKQNNSITFIASQSLTPFKTAFSITLGIGLAQTVLLIVAVGSIFLMYKLFTM